MVYKWIDSILSRLPGDCLLCGARTDGRGLCSGCLADLPRIAQACPACAQPLPAGELCGHCRRQHPPFATTRAPWLYAPPVDTLIRQLKTPAAAAPARVLGDLLADHLGATGAALPDLLVPVPLHPGRLRERGFNQAALLAQRLSRQLGLPWRSDLLVKPRESADQRTLDKRQRRRNLRGCFACRPLPAGCHVALVDDVVTTGATAWEASLALQAAGAGRVEVWALARTP